MIEFLSHNKKVKIGKMFRECKYYFTILASHKLYVNSLITRNLKFRSFEVDSLLSPGA